MRRTIVDTNIHLFRWPYRRLNGDETHDLVDKLRHYNVTQAWAGSFEGVFQFDVSGVNERLAHECKQHGHGILNPFGTVNIALPDWEEELRRCHEVHKMPGIRLHPNYHGYKLDDPKFLRVLQLATERHLIVQLVVSMEDVRMQHELFQIPNTDLAPLENVVSQVPNLRLVLAQCFRGINRPLLTKLAQTKKVFLEMSSLEGVAALEPLLKQVPASQILFGSHAPFFYFEAAYLKTKESAMTDEQREAILEKNARQLLRW